MLNEYLKIRQLVVTFGASVEPEQQTWRAVGAALTGHSGFADAASSHLFAIVSHRSQRRTLTRYNRPKFVSNIEHIRISIDFVNCQYNR